MNSNRPIIILAGGVGSRLSSVLNGLPKPLADINGIPFLKLLLQNYIKHGFNKFYFSLHYKASMIIDFLKNESSLLANCTIGYAVEEEPLGTGGAIAFMINYFKLGGYIGVLNGDTWIESGLDKIASHRMDLLSLVQVQDTSRYGSVFIDNSGLVEGFSEKKEGCGNGLINAGFYNLHTDHFKNWNNQSFSLEQKLLPKLVKERKLYGKILKTSFIDIGIPEDYKLFCKWNK